MPATLPSPAPLPGPRFFYTLGCSNASPRNGALYTAPFTPGCGLTLKARAWLAGYSRQQQRHNHDMMALNRQLSSLNHFMSNPIPPTVHRRAGDSSPGTANRFIPRPHQVRISKRENVQDSNRLRRRHRRADENAIPPKCQFQPDGQISDLAIILSLRRRLSRQIHLQPRPRFRW